MSVRQGNNVIAGIPQLKTINGESIVGSGDVEVKGGGSGLELCDIGMALYVDESKGLRRYLNGSLLEINTNTQAFVDRLKEIQAINPDVFTTETDWQAELTSSKNNVCYKFVIDETVGTVRLPKYPDYVTVGADGVMPVVGNGITLGFKVNNVNYGVAGQGGTAGTMQLYSGAYGKVSGEATTGGTTAPVSVGYGVSTDAEKSGIQALSNIDELKLKYFIQIATGSETEAEIINTLELNNPYTLFDSKYVEAPLYNMSWLKADGTFYTKAVYITAYEALLVESNSSIAIGATTTLPSGSSYTKRGLSVKTSADTYSDYDFVVNSSNETFRLPIKSHIITGQERVLVAKKEPTTEDPAWYNWYSDGWLEQGGVISGNSWTSDNSFITLNFIKNFADTNYVFSKTMSSNYGASLNSTNFSYNNKTQNSINIGGCTYNYIQEQNWYACGYGAIPTAEEYNSTVNTYYYIGETIQNAGLIDAGRITENFISKDDRETVINWGMPDYDAGVSLENYITTTNPYTAPVTGWIFLQGRNSNGTASYFYINGVQVKYMWNASQYNFVERFFLNKGDTIYTIFGGGATETQSVFYPCKGVTQNV